MHDVHRALTPAPAVRRRWRSLAVAAVHAALCALCATPLEAQENAPRIADVRVEQEGQVLDDPVIASLIETKVGDPFAMSSVRETMAHLTSLNRFEDVQVYREDGPGGVRIRYLLVPLHPIDHVEFRGTLGVPTEDLRRAVSDRVGLLPSAGRMNEAVAAIRQAYERKGYRSPTITPRIEETHDPDRATMVFDITAGPRLTITDLRIEQIDAADQNVLLGIPAIREGQPYDSDAIERELQKWTDNVRSRGYYEAQARHFPSFTPGGVFLTVNLVRGPHVTVAFAGDPLSEAERERLVPVRAEGSADEDLLEDSRRAVEEYLHERGYRDATAEYTRNEAEGELTITFNVNRGPRYVLGGIDVEGNSAVTDADVEQAIRMKPGDSFVEGTLDAGLSAVRNLYRARGFTAAKVEPMENVIPPDRADDPTRRVTVAITVAEGPRTLVRALSFAGNMALTDAELARLMTTAAGAPFSQAQLVSDVDAVGLAYRNRGYDSVVVEPDTRLAENDTQADVVLTISEGPQILVDRIIIVGNTRTKTETIERELVLQPGAPLGYSARLESQQRLSALGLFRRVTIEEVAHGSEPRRDLLVRVEEAPPTTFGFGGGLEVGARLRLAESGVAEERIDFVPRAFVEVGRRNLWGKNRAVTLFTRVSLRSREAFVNTATSSDPVLVTQNGFNEYRVFGTFREPKVAGSRADLLVTGIFDQAVRTSFNFISREARAQLGMRLSPRYSLTGMYSIERTELFDEHFGPDQQPLIDRLFPQVRLSKFSGSVIRDSRDDPVDPNSGTFVIVDGEMAARALGSQVGFVRTFLQGYAYRRLPSARRIVLATGARVGLAHGFERPVPREDGSGNPVLGPDGSQIVDVVKDLPASERFFAGGDTTVRGFSLDRLGNEDTITPSGFPKGGNGEIVLNAELRVALIRSFEGGVFVDAGNVFLEASDLTVTDLRPAAGFGLRFRSPVGPIRVDLGFNLDRRELVAGQLERSPILHISLGQAF